MINSNAFIFSNKSASVPVPGGFVDSNNSKRHERMHASKHTVAPCGTFYINLHTYVQLLYRSITDAH